MVLTKRFQKELEMAYQTVYGQVSNTNQLVFDVPAGATVNGVTFAAGGTYDVVTTYTTDTNTVPSYARQALSWGTAARGSTSWGPLGGNDMDVIDALFALKPRLKKKYKGDRDAFRKDLLDAAEYQRQARAIDKLDDLLEIEL